MPAHKSGNNAVHGVAVAKEDKIQPSIEYLSTFSVAILLILIILAVLGLNIFNNNLVQTFTQPSCYISAQIKCFQMVIANNGLNSYAFVVFTNNLGAQINFPASNSIVLQSLGSSNASYHGSCYPTNAVPGAMVTCNVTLSGYTPAVGSQVNPAFQIKYSECINRQCASYNTSGTSTTYVSPRIILRQVLLVTDPPGGHISINGVPYQSNSIFDFINNMTYSISSPVSYDGVNFQGWVTQSGIHISNPSSISSSVYVVANGVIEASFVIPSQSTSLQTTSIAPQTSSTTTVTSITGLYSTTTVMSGTTTYSPPPTTITAGIGTTTGFTTTDCPITQVGEQGTPCGYSTSAPVTTVVGGVTSTVPQTTTVLPPSFTTTIIGDTLCPTGIIC